MARLIDTSVIIEFERRRHPPEGILLLGAGEPVALASITASELLFGIERARTSQHRDRRLAFVEAVLSIAFLHHDFLP